MPARIILLAALGALWGCDVRVSRGPEQTAKTGAPSRVGPAAQPIPAARETSHDASSRLAPNARIGTVPEDLLAKRLTIPVPSVKAHSLTPEFYDARGERGHEAIDIMAPKGQPVVAVEDGTIAKLFFSKAGGITIYQFDPTEKYTYYYAHLARYADGLAQGDKVKRGQTIGYVGSTGNADAAAPHLHFAIFLLGPEKRWWKGEALDPYPALTQR
jgi:murein DD-endopeptidase MepM/ murein hydrolase activator NlpD